MTLPGGTVTFLFLDIEGSTGLLERIGAGYPQLLTTYREITERAVDRLGGAIFGSEGDCDHHRGFTFELLRFSDSARTCYPPHFSAGLPHTDL